jgi:hypothetical protein
MKRRNVAVVALFSVAALTQFSPQPARAVGPVATAQVKEDTVPASSGLWTFTLTGPNGLSETLNNVQAGAGYAAFTSPLSVDGAYTITQTPQSGYDLTNVTGDLGGDSARVSENPNALNCSFTLNFSTDSGKIFECGFTDTQRGSIIVKKATNPVGAAGSFTFTGDAAGSIGDGGTITVNQLPPGTYTSTESDPTPAFDLAGLSCNDGASPTVSTVSLATRTVTFRVDPGETVTCTFINRQRGTLIVKKVTNPVGSPGTFAFTGDVAGSIGDGGTITANQLSPGTYTSTESDPTPAFDLSGLSCNDSLSPTVSTVSLATRTATFRLDPGETVTCTFIDRARGHVRVVKTANGVAPSGNQSFPFQLRSGASAASSGTILESVVANAANGGVINFATFLVPGTTYQLCEQTTPGWTTTLGSPIFAVYNPSGDTSVVCTDFTVTAGQTKIFSIDNAGTAAAIRVLKLTNGSDNDTAPGPTLPVGSTATFTYLVTNPGNAPLVNVAVLDDNGTPANPADDFTPTFTGGDNNANGTLDPSETWTYTAARIVTPGQYTNTGTVTGSGGGSTVTSSNVDNHFGGACSTTLTGNIPGSVRVTSGTTCLTNASVAGGVHVTGGNLFIRSSSISGGLNANRGGQLWVCNSTIHGTVSVANATGFVLLGGDGAAGCAGNVFQGSAHVHRNSGGVRVAGNQTAGSVALANNLAPLAAPDPTGGSAATVVRHNTIGGGLSCKGDVPPATNDGVTNSVTGPRTGECATL